MLGQEWGNNPLYGPLDVDTDYQFQAPKLIQRKDYGALQCAI